MFSSLLFLFSDLVRFVRERCALLFSLAVSCVRLNVSKVCPIVCAWQCYFRPFFIAFSFLSFFPCHVNYEAKQIELMHHFTLHLITPFFAKAAAAILRAWPGQYAMQCKHCSALSFFFSILSCRCSATTKLYRMRTSYHFICTSFNCHSTCVLRCDDVGFRALNVCITVGLVFVKNSSRLVQWSAVPLYALP